MKKLEEAQDFCTVLYVCPGVSSLKDMSQILHLEGAGGGISSLQSRGRKG